MTKDELRIEAKYLDHRRQARIVRDRLAGVKVWRIARDTELPVTIVKEVLRQHGINTDSNRC